MVFYNYTKENSFERIAKCYKKEWCNMLLNYEISKKREELNKSIEEGQDYSITYRISVELDDLIAEYYRRMNEVEISENQSSIFARR